MSARARAARARRRAFDPALLSEAARTFLGGDGSSHVLAYADVVGLARGERVNQRWRAEAARLRPRAEEAFRGRDDVEELFSDVEELKTIHREIKKFIVNGLQERHHTTDDVLADRLAHNWEQGYGAHVSNPSTARRAESFASFINHMDTRGIKGNLLISAKSDEDVDIWFNAFRRLPWLRELPQDVAVDVPPHDHYLVHREEDATLDVIICTHDTSCRLDRDLLNTYPLKWIVIDDGDALDPDAARRPWRILANKLAETQYHMSALPHRGLELDELAFRFTFPTGHGAEDVRELLGRARNGQLGNIISRERCFILELFRREVEVLLATRATHIAAAPAD
mmetsp:Transcript_29833/g.89741  ORF Transcript_29833/g.89741 Transcript_29833/m.89741 type:complete len:340 (+) Transcript_29833:1599-2618(+)